MWRKHRADKPEMLKGAIQELMLVPCACRTPHHFWANVVPIKNYWKLLLHAQIKFDKECSYNPRAYEPVPLIHFVNIFKN